MNASRKTILIIAALADIAIIAGAGITTYVMTQRPISGIIAGFIAAIVILTVDLVLKRLVLVYLMRNPDSMPWLRRLLGLL